MKARKGAARLRGYSRRLALLVVILWLLIDLRVRLWLLPYGKVRAHVDGLATGGAAWRDVGVDWIVRWIERMGRIVPMATCLVRALTLQVLLARRGIVVDVVFGAKRNRDRRFEAHAWVEYRGRVLLGRVPDLEKFHVLRREVVEV